MSASANTFTSMQPIFKDKYSDERFKKLKEKLKKKPNGK